MLSHEINQLIAFLYIVLAEILADNYMRLRPKRKAFYIICVLDLIRFFASIIRLVFCSINVFCTYTCRKLKSESAESR